MVEVILGLILGVVSGYCVRRWADTRRSRGTSQLLSAPYSKVPAAAPPVEKGATGGGALDEGGSGQASGHQDATTWRERLRNDFVRVIDDPPMLLAALIVLVLAAAYVIHLGFILTLYDYQSLEETFLRFVLAIVIGYITYLVAYLVGHPEAKKSDIPEGVQVTARNLGIAAILLTLILVLYLKPSHLMKDILGRLQGAEFLGVKLSISPGQIGGGNDSNIGYRSPAVSADSFAEPFPGPLENLRLGFGMLEQVRDRKDGDYYRVLGLERYAGFPGSDRPIKVFDNVFHPAAGCLNFLGSRSLLSADLNLEAATLNLEMRELYRRIMDPNSTERKAAAARRHKYIVGIDEETRKRLATAVEKFLERLNSEWWQIRLRYPQLFDTDHGNWGEGKQIERDSSPGKPDDSWRACNAPALMFPHLRGQLLEQSLKKVDLRRDELPVLASFLSLYIGDRPHAIQRLDIWAASVFYPEVTDGNKAQISKQELLSAAKDYCGRLPSGEDLTKRRHLYVRRVLLCLSHLRINFFQERILSLYTTETAKRDRIRSEIFDSISASANGLYEIASALPAKRACQGVGKVLSRKRKQCEADIKDKRDLACRSGAPQFWFGECEPGMARLLRLDVVNRNNVVFLRSKLPGDLTRTEIEESDTFCEDSLGEGSDRLIKTIGGGDEKRMGLLRSVFADTCARWELRRTEWMWGKKLSDGEAADKEALRKGLVGRLKRARKWHAQTLHYWKHEIEQEVKKQKESGRDQATGRQFGASIFRWGMDPDIHATESLIESEGLSDQLLRAIKQVQAASVD